MSKTMIKPGPDLLQRVTQAFLDHGYGGLSMVTMARACGFTQCALLLFQQQGRRVPGDDPIRQR
jgi:hypothetical protein